MQGKIGKPPFCRTVLTESKKCLPSGEVAFLLGLQDSVSNLSALVRSGVACLGLRLRVVVLVLARVFCSWKRLVLWWQWLLELLELERRL